MLKWLTKISSFSVIYFLVLTLDIVVKHSVYVLPFRFFTKSGLLILLFAYYIINHKENKRHKYIAVLVALSAFLIGDILMMFSEVQLCFLIGMLAFVIGKACYGIRFSHSEDFKVRKLLPFIIICFGYVIFLFTNIYEGLGSFWLPVMVYFFVTLMMVLMAYLRHGVVNKLSFLLVFIGVICSLFSDSIVAYKEFKTNIPLQEVLVMLFYGVSQYLIIIGLVYGTNNRIVSKNKVFNYARAIAKDKRV